MRTVRHGIVALIVGSFLATAATTALAGEVFRWTFADPNEPTKTPTAAQALIFKSEVEKLSAGQINVEIFPNGQLGDQRSMVQQVRRGTIGAANIAVGVLGSLYYPKLGVIDLPFLYTSRAQFRRVMENSNPFIHELIDDLAKASGIRVLGFQPYGFRQITNNKRPIEKPADMAGLKIRTMEIVPHQEMMKALGAIPVPIPYLELYTSLQTGVVEGQENPPTNIFQQKFYQVQKYMTLSNHLMTVGAIIVNDKWFQSLSPELRKAVTDAEREARLGHDGVGAVQDLLLINEIEKMGTQVARLSPQQIDAFRKATVGPVRAWAEQQWGKDFVAGFYKNLSDTDRY